MLYGVIFMVGTILDVISVDTCRVKIIMGTILDVISVDTCRVKIITMNSPLIMKNMRLILFLSSSSSCCVLFCCASFLSSGSRYFLIKSFQNVFSSLPMYRVRPNPRSASSSHFGEFSSSCFNTVCWNTGFTTRDMYKQLKLSTRLNSAQYNTHCRITPYASAIHTIRYVYMKFNSKRTLVTDVV